MKILVAPIGVCSYLNDAISASVYKIVGREPPLGLFTVFGDMILARLESV